MELSNRAKSVVDKFINFINLADKENDSARISYNNFGKFIFFKNECVHHGRAHTTLEPQRVLAIFCSIELLSAEEASAVLKLAEAKKYWIREVSKENLENVIFGRYDQICVRK